MTAGSKSYEYDLAGRTKKVTNLLSVTNLTYDDEDRLLTVVGPGISQSYTYNGADTRVSKTHNGSLTSYQRDGVGVTAPLISDSGAVYTPGVSEKRGGVSTFLHGGMKDLGAQSDSSQNLTAARQYDAYGMVVASTGTWKGPFGYSGKAGYQEDESGLQLLGHRYYDSSTGRFLTRDPIQDGRNWYVYCDSNPITYIDAEGLSGNELEGPIARGEKNGHLPKGTLDRYRKDKKFKEEFHQKVGKRRLVRGDSKRGNLKQIIKVEPTIQI